MSASVAKLSSENIFFNNEMNGHISSILPMLAYSHHIIAMSERNHTNKIGIHSKRNWGIDHRLIYQFHREEERFSE